MSGQSPTLSERFAAHALTGSPPAAVRAAVRAFTLDTIGVGIGGARSPYAPGMLKAVRGWGEGAAASAWIDGARLPAPHAAFVNAFLAHCQEFDCVHEGAVLHPFTVVTPVLLAEAEARGLSGADYVAACAVGVDVAAGLGLAAKTQIQFFRPATCGLFGAIAALARARRLSQDIAVNAFGYGLAYASGTMQAHVEGTPALAIQVANAARAAFHAVDLAEAGLPGPRRALDGPFGYLTLFEKESDAAPVAEALGQTWRAAQVSWKPYPTGRAAHGGIDMIRTLRAEGLVADAVDSIAFTVPPLIVHLVGRPIVAPLEVNYARLCLPYAAATALRKGAVGLADFTPEALADQATHELAARITVTADANPDPAAFVPQSVVVRLKSGEERRAALTALPGSVARPLSRDEQIAKFRACVAFGRSAPDAAAEDALIARIDAIETETDVGALNRLAAGRP
jgi:2-methylcitrate dehydratase PrpD